LANNRVTGAVTTGFLAVVSAVLPGSQITIKATCLNWHRNFHINNLSVSGVLSDMNAVNLKDKLETFSEHWSPRIVADFNGNDVMVVKVKGEFNWHSHPDTDDFFLVIKGQITIKLRDKDVHLSEGELFVVPKGVEHCPVAADEAELLLIEPHGTPNTGDEATATTKIKI